MLTDSAATLWAVLRWQPEPKRKERKRMKKLSRRSFIKGVAATAGVIAAGGALSGCGGSKDGGSGDKPAVDTKTMLPLTIGYWGGNCCELGVYVAIENGCFQAAGIDPTIMVITADTTTLLANDEIDFFLVTPGNFPAVVEGVNLKVVDTMHTGCWSGMTLEKTGVTDCASLSGRKVGTSSLTHPAYVETMALCARQGGDPSKIDWVIYDNSLLLQALKDGEVDAIIGIDSSLYPTVMNTEGGKFFYTSAQELADYYCCFIGCNSHTLEAHPEAGDKLALAFANAVDILNQDVDAAVEMAIEKGYTVGEYPEIEKGLARNYLYNHGNHDDFTASIKERFRELYDCGLLGEDAKNMSEDEAEAFLDQLTEQFGEWHGDVAAAARPLAELAAERGDAFGTDANDLKNL